MLLVTRCYCSVFLKQKPINAESFSVSHLLSLQLLLVHIYASTASISTIGVTWFISILHSLEYLYNFTFSCYFQVGHHVHMALLITHAY